MSSLMTHPAHVTEVYQAKLPAHDNAPPPDFLSERKNDGDAHGKAESHQVFTTMNGSDIDNVIPEDAMMMPGDGDGDDLSLPGINFANPDGPALPTTYSLIKNNQTMMAPENLHNPRQYQNKPHHINQARSYQYHPQEYYPRECHHPQQSSWLSSGAHHNHHYNNVYYHQGQYPSQNFNTAGEDYASTEEEFRDQAAQAMHRSAIYVQIQSRLLGLVTRIDLAGSVLARSSHTYLYV